jgi:Tol biopolymer transport system component
MRPDGSDVQLVIDVFALSPVGQAPGGQFQAGLDWSPDGQLLAFSFQPEEAGSPQIYTVHADGSQQTQLTTAGTTEAGRNTFDPAFSPQGNRIVFTVEGVLHTMGSEGGDVKRLLKESRGVGDFDPSWQPR